MAGDKGFAAGRTGARTGGDSRASPGCIRPPRSSGTFFIRSTMRTGMRGRAIWIELSLILLALTFAELGEVLRELRTDVVLDWFVSLAPLIWINVSILFLYAFVRLYRSPDLAPPDVGSSRRRVWAFIIPNFRALRACGRTFRRIWALSAVGYAFAFMVLQGILVVDPSGSIEPVFTDLESPIGYGPGIAWAPTSTFGVQIRPYGIAVVVILSLLSGLVIALSLQVVIARRRAATALPAPLLGFAVMCPACVGAPLSGLFLAYLAPIAFMGGMGAAVAFSRMLVISTALLITTLILLWIVISMLSRLGLESQPAVVPGAS